VDLTTYGTDRAPGARAWAAAIEEELLTGRMPPWQADPRFDHFANTRRMTKDELDILVAWIGGGAPQGPRRNLPTPPEFEPGAWQLGEPDLVVEPPSSFTLASGVVADTTTHVLDVTIDEDTWVTGYEFQPQNPGAVYRMAAWILDPEDAPAESLEVEIQVPYDPFRDEDEPEPTRLYELPVGSHFLGQWLRGDTPVLLPEGMGKRLRQGSRIRLVTEYRRRESDGTASEVADASRLGLFLAQEADEVDLVLLSASAHREQQPAGKKKRGRKKKGRGAPVAAPSRATLSFDEDVRLISLAPNLGTALEDVEIEIRYPDGRAELLLLIEQYDPRWPASFQLLEPVAAPAGAVLSMQGRFGDAADDSSASRDFGLEVTYALNDHLVLPEIVDPAKPPTSRGGMMLGGESAAGEGTAPVDARAAAHMDHSPLHGGQFFMASNNYHHLEGALPQQDEFRVWVYDDFKKPVDPRNFAGKVVFETWDADNEQWLENAYDLEYGPPGTEYMSATIPGELPAEFFAEVWLAGEPTRYDFYFEELSKELSAAELARYAAQGAHSHEREPVVMPERAEDVVAEIVLRTEVLRQLMDQEEWLALHVPAFDARDFAAGLLDKLEGLNARERGSVRQAVSRAMQAAAELDRAGDLADAGRARRAFDRYNEAVRVLVAAFE
jgi:hypothetical protein